MAINTIADIVARGPLRKVYTFNAAGSVTTLASQLAFYLKKLGWSGSAASWTSRSIHNHGGYEQNVKITWVVSGGSELHITVNDSAASFGGTQFLILKPCSNDCFIMGGPFQFILMPIGVNPDQCGILVSTLNLPTFSTNKNCIVGFELGSFLRDYAVTTFNNYFAGYIDSSGGAVYINPPSSSSSIGTVSLPTYTAKIIANFFGPFGVKSPAWLQWGSTSPADVPTLKGFLWDMFLWYDNRFTGQLERLVIDSRASLQLANANDNILVFEYGQVEQP